MLLHGFLIEKLLEPTLLRESAAKTNTGTSAARRRLTRQDAGRREKRVNLELSDVTQLDRRSRLRTFIRPSHYDVRSLYEM